MGKESGKMASLNFNTLEDIQSSSFLSEKAQRIWLKVKDHFHNNEKFYEFAKKPDHSAQPVHTKKVPFHLRSGRLKLLRRL
jgi:hypothetical protein